MDAENVKHFFEKSFVCGRQGEFSLLDAQGRFKMDAVLIGLGFRFHTLPLLDVRSCCGFTWHDYTGTARAEQRTNRPGLGKYGQKPCICGGKTEKAAEAFDLCGFSRLVGVARLELAASCSQSRRATNCATPRKNFGYPITIPFFGRAVKVQRAENCRTCRVRGRTFHFRLEAERKMVYYKVY